MSFLYVKKEDGLTEDKIIPSLSLKLSIYLVVLQSWHTVEIIFVLQEETTA